jgi:hypothetical protein
VGDPATRIAVYITEDPNRLYAEFSISYNCEDLTTDGRSGAILVLKGDCIYLVKEKQFSAFRSHGEELSFKTKDGEDQRRRNVTVFTDGLVIGHRTVEHSVRYRLDD